MKIIDASVEYMEQNQLTDYQFIEKIGRTCYKSEDNITTDSAERFVGNLIKNGHEAMLEHGYIYLYIPYLHTLLTKQSLIASQITKYINICDKFITGSFRAFRDIFKKIFTDAMYTDRMLSGCADLLFYLEVLFDILVERYPLMFSDIQKPECMHLVISEAFSNARENITVFGSRSEFIDFVKNLHDERPFWDPSVVLFYTLPHTVRFTCDRGVTHELVRHRPPGYAMESTRYCNYSKGKFGGEITVIKPLFFPQGTPRYSIWEKSCKNAEADYFDLLNAGATPQEARIALPHSVKADLIMIATEEEWQHIINLRYHGTTGQPHPQMKEVMALAYPHLVKFSDGRIK